ncbi:MAG: hypothetical protein U1E25_16095 [Methylocystis sp.]
MRRITLDVNKAISPILAVRVNALYHDSNVAGRSFITDYRDGVAGSVVSRRCRFDADRRIYACLSERLAGLWRSAQPSVEPATMPEGVIPRYNWYGFVNRDFQVALQNFGTFTAHYRYNDNLVFDSRFRQSRSVLDYIGSLKPRAPTFLPAL